MGNREIGIQYGGHKVDYTKPYVLRFGGTDSERRQIEVKSTVWETLGSFNGIGGGGHHHVDIKEEDNYILLRDNTSNKLWWSQPWGWYDDEELRSLLKGRSDFNTELFTKKDVVKWAVEVLRTWGVLGDKRYKIVWVLDNDDPNANPELSKLMRRRMLDEGML